MSRVGGVVGGIVGGIDRWSIVNGVIDGGCTRGGLTGWLLDSGNIGEENERSVSDTGS